MKKDDRTEQTLLFSIWQSFRAMPTWVQLWVGVILVPVNAASLFFINQPSGRWIALLAVLGMLPNLFVMIFERGFSKLMALPHLIPWTILVVMLLFAVPDVSGPYRVYLWILLATDLFSLVLDYPDAIKWFRGERAVAGR